MKKKFLYLPIESKVRELDSKLLIALQAIKNDYVVIIGSKSFMRYMRFLPKGVLFYMNCTSPMFKLFNNYKTFGHKIVVHDEEGLAPSDWNDYLKRRIIFESIKKVDLFFSFGMKQKNTIESHLNKINSDCKLISVGHPRIDLLRKPIRDYNKVDEENIILINTKFAEVNHRTGDDGWLNVLNHHEMIKNSDQLNFRLEQIEYKKKLFDEYLHLIKDLSNDFPDYKIIVRPHPNENIYTWISSTKEFNNVEVINKKPIGYWLQKASVIIHTHCTTAIEGYLLDKPVISFEPINDLRFQIPLPKSVSIVVKSRVDCLNQINNILDDSFRYADYIKSANLVLSQNIDSLKGDFSFVKIVDEIKLLFIPNYKINWALNLKISLLMKIEIGINLLKLMLSKKNPYYNDKISKDSMSKVEIEDKIARLSTYVDLESSISLSKLAKNTFIIGA